MSPSSRFRMCKSQAELSDSAMYFGFFWYGYGIFYYYDNSLVIYCTALVWKCVVQTCGRLCWMQVRHRRWSVYISDEQQSQEQIHIKDKQPQKRLSQSYTTPGSGTARPCPRPQRISKQLRTRTWSEDSKAELLNPKSYSRNSHEVFSPSLLRETHCGKGKWLWHKQKLFPVDRASTLLLSNFHVRNTLHVGLCNVSPIIKWRNIHITRRHSKSQNHWGLSSHWHLHILLHRPTQKHMET